MSLLEAQEVAQLFLQLRHVVADARLAAYVDKRQVLGNLRSIHTNFLGNLR